MYSKLFSFTFIVAAMIPALNSFNLDRGMVNFNSFVPISTSENKTHICNGVILSKRWILASAGCITKYSETGVLTANLESGDIEISDIVIHPDFQAEQLLNNIALLKTNADIQFQPSKVEPAKLSSAEPLEGEEAVVVSLDGRPGSLKHYATEVMATDLCWERLEDVGKVKINDNVVCIEYLRTGPDSVLLTANTNELVGIISWHQDEYPNVYTKIFSHLPWIQFAQK